MKKEDRKELSAIEGLQLEAGAMTVEVSGRDFIISLPGRFQREGYRLIYRGQNVVRRYGLKIEGAEPGTFSLKIRSRKRGKQVKVALRAINNAGNSQKSEFEVELFQGPKRAKKVGETQLGPYTLIPLDFEVWGGMSFTALPGEVSLQPGLVYSPHLVGLFENFELQVKLGFQLARGPTSIFAWLDVMLASRYYLESLSPTLHNAFVSIDLGLGLLMPETGTQAGLGVGLSGGYRFRDGPWLKLIDRFIAGYRLITTSPVAHQLYLGVGIAP